MDITRRLGYGYVNTVFDVGANTGQTYRIFRREFPAAFIRCFEPVTATFDKLALQIEGDVLAKAEKFAFGEQPGEKTILLFDHSTDLNSLRDDLMNCARDAVEETVRIDTSDCTTYLITGPPVSVSAMLCSSTIP